MRKTISELVAIQMTSAHIDETHDNIKIMSYEYRPSHVLYEFDPDAFRDYMLSYMDSLGYDVVE